MMPRLSKQLITLNSDWEIFELEMPAVKILDISEL